MNQAFLLSINCIVRLLPESCSLGGIYCSRSKILHSLVRFNYDLLHKSDLNSLRVFFNLQEVIVPSSIEKRAVGCNSPLTLARHPSITRMALGVFENIEYTSYKWFDYLFSRWVLSFLRIHSFHSHMLGNQVIHSCYMHSLGHLTSPKFLDRIQSFHTLWEILVVS